MIYGYARVSTKGQAHDGNSLDAQEKILIENGAQVIYKESFTGMKKHRPQLDKLISELKDGDTLIVTKLDRMARSTIHGSKLVQDLLDRNIKVNILNMGIMDNTPASKLMRTMFFAFAEFERDMIVERTSEGKEIAKRKEGFKEGRPNKEVGEFEQYYQKYLKGGITATEAAKQLGISRATWYKLVKKVA